MLRGSPRASAEELVSGDPLGHTKGFSEDQPLGSSGEPSRNPCDAGNLGSFYTQGNGGTRRPA